MGDRWLRGTNDRKWHLVSPQPAFTITYCNRYYFTGYSYTKLRPKRHERCKHCQASAAGLEK